MTLLELFEPSLARSRIVAGLQFAGRVWTFGELETRSNRLARLLEQRGLQRGDRLCVQLANCVEVVELFLACLKRGAVFVPINILYRPREVERIVADAEPRLVLTAREATELAEAAAELPAERLAVEVGTDTPVAIIYTSGTTGAPKGVVLTHGNFAANARNVIGCWEITREDRLLLALPLFHVHGLGNGLVSWLATACRMRLLERFDYRTAAAQFLDFRPTLFFGVPTMYVRLLELPEDTAREIGRSMRLFVSGSAPLPAAALEEFERRFGHRILERYGMTETLMIASNPCQGERQAGTVGLPLPGVEVRVVAGELYVRGPNVFSAYWRNEEATRNAFTDGYFRTGDLAVRSADGYYTLQGRKDDLIICGGFNVYPREIEELLLQQEGVDEAAVVGAPDALRGQVPVAYIVSHSGCDTGRLEAICRENLASFKVPRAFVQVDALPRNALGKIQRHLLPRWQGGSG